MSEDEAELHKVEFVQRAREIPGTLQQSFRATHGSWPEGERSWTIIAKDYVGLTSAVIDNAVPRKLGKYHHQQQHLVYKDGSDDVLFSDVQWKYDLCYYDHNHYIWPLRTEAQCLGRLVLDFLFTIKA